MSGYRKIIIVVVFTFLFLLSTLVAAALFITWAIFDKNPTVLYTPHIPDIVVLNNIIQKISSNLLNEETSQQLIDPNILLVLELNEKEVNEIILSGIQTYINSGENPQACEQLKNFRIKFKDGFFYADYSFLTNITSPFGSYINIHCVFVPELSNDNINVNVSSLKIGALSMPSSKIDKFIRDAIKKEKNNKNVQLFLNSVKEIKVKDSKLLIKYSPSAALNLILNQSNSAL